VDATNSVRPLYSSDGSARVCSIDIIGGGSELGNLRTDVDGNARVVDVRPCSVNGRSRNRVVYDGLI
jgi:hypothetical protein